MKTSRRHLLSLYHKPIDIDKMDITKLPLKGLLHNLGWINRFAGAAREMTVLDHTYAVWRYVLDHGGSSAACAQAILHEVPEGITNDIPSYIKLEVPAMDTYDKQLLRKVFEAHGLPDRMLPLVKRADNAVLRAEKKFFKDPTSYPPPYKTLLQKQRHNDKLVAKLILLLDIHLRAIKRS